jgi:hypothetical protein
MNKQRRRQSLAQLARRSPGTSRSKEQLEQAFYQLWLRLNRAERERLADQFAQPHRRQWLIVDENGVRQLEEGG